MAGNPKYTSGGSSKRSKKDVLESNRRAGVQAKATYAAAQAGRSQQTKMQEELIKKAQDEEASRKRERTLIDNARPQDPRSRTQYANSRSPGQPNSPDARPFPAVSDAAKKFYAALKKREEDAAAAAEKNSRAIIKKQGRQTTIAGGGYKNIK